VAAVMENSPAKAAGLQVGDLLLSIDGEKLENLRSFSEILKKHEPGDVVKVIFQRGDEEKSASVTLNAR